MSLDALAPDQRAVVQLVLQQDRSYEDLAALLGITPAAVRERAHRGIERLAPGEAVDPADRAQITDYLLGQQSVSGREATRGLLSASQPARSWAQAVASDLAGVARGALPEIPSGPTSAPTPEPEQTEPLLTGDNDPILEDPIAPTRARPRPRQRAQEADPVPADFGFGEATGVEPSEAVASDPGETPRTSKLGGALLIAGLAIFVAALIIWLVNRDDDNTDSQADTTSTPTTTAEATPTASGTPQFRAIGLIRLKAPDGGEPTGRVVVFAAQTGEVAFNLQAKKVPPSTENQAYGVWITGGPESHFLGFAPPVDESGKLATSGPREQDAANFATWLADPGAEVVVSEETQEGATEPGPLVLQGSVDAAQSPAATPQP